MLVSVIVAAGVARGDHGQHATYAYLLELARAIAEDLREVEVTAVCGPAPGDAVVFNHPESAGDGPELF